MSQWKRIGIILGVLIAFLAGIFIGSGQFNGASALPNSMYNDLKTLADVIDYIQKDYVEETKSKDLVYGAIKGMLETLDPHSGFLPPDMFKEMKEETKGRFEGLGIEITQKEGVLTVVSPIEDTPAYKAGILSGDQIIKIEAESTKGMNLMECVKRLRGPRGTKVTITIMREGFAKPREITLVREVIPVRSVRYELLDQHYGYIRISQFQEKTDSEFGTAMKALEDESKRSLKGIILDLRNNPGGLLDEAVDITDRFIDSGLIVSIDGRREDVKKKFFAKSEGTITQYPLVVLVNGGSASGSEIVAGAIQDHGRGILLGTQTFGKGSVQNVIELKDGSGLKLTTARYYTPSGRSIQAKGIVPDIIVKPAKSEDEKEKEKEKEKDTPVFPSEKDLERHLTNGEEGAPVGKQPVQENEIFKQSEKKESKDKKPFDNQKERALELLKSWDVFKNQIRGGRG